MSKDTVQHIAEAVGLFCYHAQGGLPESGRRTAHLIWVFVVCVSCDTMTPFRDGDPHTHVTSIIQAAQLHRACLAHQMGE